MKMQILYQPPSSHVTKEPCCIFSSISLYHKAALWKSNNLCIVYCAHLQQGSSLHAVSILTHLISSNDKVLIEDTLGLAFDHDCHQIDYVMCTGNDISWVSNK